MTQRRVVAKADNEIARIDFHYLMSGDAAAGAAVESAETARRRAPAALKEG